MPAIRNKPCKPLLYASTNKSKSKQLMNLLDEEYTRHPFYGVRKMREFLRWSGYNIGKDHVRTLLRRMGLVAVYPKPNISKEAGLRIEYIRTYSRI